MKLKMASIFFNFNSCKREHNQVTMWKLTSLQTQMFLQLFSYREIQLFFKIKSRDLKIWKKKQEVLSNVPLNLKWNYNPCYPHS